MSRVGIDIGYSNLKVAYGGDNSPITKLIPAGAATVDRLALNIMTLQPVDCIRVMVDGEQFGVGLTHSDATFTREIHDQYIKTRSYRALFYAGLLLTEYDHIDTLVTGLPVSHMTPENIEFLKKMMTGEHQITPKVSVTVDKVIVVPQPLGGIVDLSGRDDVPIEKNILVVDPGFFSFDWAIFQNTKYKQEFSGTSTLACSFLIEKACDLIGQDYGVKPYDYGIEDAIRRGSKKISVRGKDVEFMPYIERAAKIVAPDVVGSMRKTIRNLPEKCDLILFVGGGTSFYKDEIVKAFDDTQVIVSDDPVFANVRGFWYIAKEV